MRLMSPDAEYRMERFITGNGESPKLNEARYESGLVLLSAAQLHLCHTSGLSRLTGYCCLKRACRNISSSWDTPITSKAIMKRAQMLFAELIDVDTDYTSPALYYHSVIAYENGFYRTALEGFERLKGDETFGSVVPFYIVQIYYMDKNYDGILETGPVAHRPGWKDKGDGALPLYRRCPFPERKLQRGDTLS
ncbi:MAG: hypothetical protein MZV63_02885 [Marinilabiliales bacterium]|nr:hypothetical protein [Marinilabiliales bacterium]